MAIKQAERQLHLQTPLGENELVLTAFRGQEGISQLFTYQLEMISDNTSITASEIVGKEVTFSVRLADDSFRHFHGYVNRFSAGDEHNERRNYRAEVVPWLWFLTRTTDCRIFQKQSVPQILEKVFQDLGFSDFELKISGSRPARDYCVQYRESDFNFVSRLMEEEGVFYYFKHEAGKHSMVIANRATGYYDLPEKEVDYPDDVGSGAIDDHLTSWEHRYEFRTGKWAQTDYNFESPSDNLMTNTNTVVNLPSNLKFEFYDFPGLYTEKGDGQKLTDVRMEEAETGYDQVEGTSICRTFSPGGKFKVVQHRCKAEAGRKYVITGIEHEAVESMSYETGADAAFDYRNRFTAIPDSICFRPARVTRRPFVQGLQTATIVGPAGEEIYTDKYGRVKAQFHWDREGRKDENSSCWMRVSQAHAGKGFGAIDIPRLGEEVIVNFIEGDPDRPLITGRVYHAENMPPYGLPGSKNISGLKSNSTKGGGGYNEYIMDDTKGNELIREHGQFDKDSTIEHDLREHVLNDRSRDVTHNETILIGVDRTESVGRNETLSVASNRSRNVGGNETVTVALMRTHTVGVNEAITVGAAQEITVGALQAITVGASQIVTVGANQSNIVGSSLTELVGSDRSANVGNNDSLTVGNSLTISAGDQIVLKTGSASITMKKDGSITIKGKDITISGSGKIVGSASGNIVLKGQKILQN